MALSDITAAIAVDAQWIAKWANTGFNDTEFKDKEEFIAELTIGTGSEQINQIYVADRTLAAGANDDLDLAGVLTNPKGETVNFTQIKSIIIYNQATTVGYNLVVGGGPPTPLLSLWNASSPREDLVFPSGVWAKTAPITGYTVTAGSADILRINNAGAGSITYTIIILGIG